MEYGIPAHNNEVSCFLWSGSLSLSVYMIIVVIVIVLVTVLVLSNIFYYSVYIVFVAALCNYSLFCPSTSYVSL